MQGAERWPSGQQQGEARPLRGAAARAAAAGTARSRPRAPHTRQPAHPVLKSCIRSEAAPTDANMTPQTARPVMTPPASRPAQAANKKMASLPYRLAMFQSAAPGRGERWTRVREQAERPARALKHCWHAPMQHHLRGARACCLLRVAHSALRHRRWQRPGGRQGSRPRARSTTWLGRTAARQRRRGRARHEQWNRMEGNWMKWKAAGPVPCW